MGHAGTLTQNLLRPNKGLANSLVPLPGTRRPCSGRLSKTLVVSYALLSACSFSIFLILDGLTPSPLFSPQPCLSVGRFVGNFGG
jgi:hypothetical protein